MFKQNVVRHIYAVEYEDGSEVEVLAESEESARTIAEGDEPIKKVTKKE